MLALMHFEPRKDATQVIEPVSNTTKALQARFWIWSQKLDNLISFFKQVQQCQKDLSLKYERLSRMADTGFGDDFANDGIKTVWDAMRDKTKDLSMFYDGLSVSYESLILKDLKRLLKETYSFRNELFRISRSLEITKTEWKQRRFLAAVDQLDLSIHHDKTDPLIEHRRKFLCSIMLTCRMFGVSEKVHCAGQQTEARYCCDSAEKCRFGNEINRQN
jgi:hypothetical protein